MTRDLSPFFAPRSIAVVGAGERASSSGGAVMQMPRQAGYGGRVVPVNPRGGSIFGYESVMGTLPGKADRFATQERAGVPMFNDVEETAEAAGLLARYPILCAAAKSE